MKGDAMAALRTRRGTVIFCIIVVLVVLFAFSRNTEFDTPDYARQWTSTSSEKLSGPPPPSEWPLPSASEKPYIQLDGIYTTPRQLSGKKSTGFLEHPMLSGLPPMECPPTHHVIKSSKEDGTYWPIEMTESCPDCRVPYINSGNTTFNPNVLPHPTLKDTWIATGQDWKTPGVQSDTSDVLYCNAVFNDTALTCITKPKVVQVPWTRSTKCAGTSTEFWNLNNGPHDARFFWGPDRIYSTFGSQGHQICFGQWLQAVNHLVEVPSPPTLSLMIASEIQRPPPLRIMEKNYNLFWDRNGDMYGHFDIAPDRVYAKLDSELAITGEAPISGAGHANAACWQKHMEAHPFIDPDDRVHQTGNTLRIVLCKRADMACRKHAAARTYTMALFNHKWADGPLHAWYDPYVYLFEQDAPFATKAISNTPFWIYGQREAQEMLYVVSFNWKRANVEGGGPAGGKMNEGFLDDEILVNFGIEDRFGGVIDTTAEVLMGEMMVC